MSENSGRYSYVLFITLINIMVIFLGFIRAIFKHQTREIRYTRNQLYKIGKTFYRTKVNDITANTIKSLVISQTLKEDKKKRGTGKEKGEKEVKDVPPFDNRSLEYHYTA